MNSNLSTENKKFLGDVVHANINALPTWSEDELAIVLRLSRVTIAQKITKAPDSLPPSIKVGKKHIWLPSTVMEWLVSRQSCQSTISIKHGASSVAQNNQSLYQKKRKPGRPPGSSSRKLKAAV